MSRENKIPYGVTLDSMGIHLKLTKNSGCVRMSLDQAKQVIVQLSDVLKDDLKLADYLQETDLSSFETLIIQTSGKYIRFGIKGKEPIMLDLYSAEVLASNLLQAVAMKSRDNTPTDVHLNS